MIVSGSTSEDVSQDVQNGGFEYDMVFQAPLVKMSLKTELADKILAEIVSGFTSEDVSQDGIAWIITCTVCFRLH